ncbi:MAG: DUF4157 domain-containing protein, partial [Anaerolineaceae bacterium]|nr:DUF4157 domain-containing protein [Anaerolineaceae bacterium]
MAKTQNDHVNVQEKNPDSHLQKASSLQSEIQQDQFGLSSQLTHAANFPEQAKPETIQLLQERYGNNEVRRIVQPQVSNEPVVDQSRTLDKQIADEIQRARGGGQPLGSEISSQVTQKFGKSLNNVRLHTDRKSDQISRQINARAFTVGNDIFFRSGAYSPNSEQGKQTLLHEFAHVVQQSPSGTSSGPLKLGEPDDQFEREADQVSKSQSSSSQSGSAISKGVVQRSIFTSAKQKVGGLFGRGGNKAPAQPTPAPPLSFTTSSLPKGLTQENWAQVQQAGVKNETEWNTYSEDKKVTILSLVTQNPELAKKLITAETNKQWPTDDKGKDIFDILIINTIDGTLKSTFEDWKKVSGPHKASLIALRSESYIMELAKLASENKWPQDGNDKDISQKDDFDKVFKLGINLTKWNEIKNKEQRKFLLENTDKGFITSLINEAISGNWPKDGSNNDITDEKVFETITKTWTISLVQWNLITEANQRDFLLKNPGKKYTNELVRAAFRELWPTDGTNKAILDDGTFTKIVDGIGIELWTWINIKSAGQRDFLLNSSGSLSKETLNELAKSAFSGVWPKDG